MKPGAALEKLGATIASRYRVEQVVGQGGMATVYRVQDERAGKQVALKRCRARDPMSLQRNEALLEREYHTLAQLAHPRIIEVYDYGVDGRGPYYTMELLDGANLEKLERMPWRQACEALRDIASSLAILHSRGLVHRDVSVRNVHYAANGHVKLFDFGAMTSMGVAKDAVGTPPFMAPEVLQLQALDARVDLYSLGALGYRILTGRHAYPAKRLSELRDVWRSKPQAPAAIVPEIPVELSRLILRMLTLDRAGRPQSAGEVIEQLRTVANLEREDAAEISRAYLTTPTLVGREAALLAVRRRMLSLVRGDGGLVIVEGVAGAGRSRMLDAFALEGKLLGAAVLRADARDASNGEWGVARALGTQLLQQLHKPATEAARLSRNVLGHVLEELQSDEPHTATGYAPERSLLIRELREWVLSVSKAQRLLIVVDDAEQIDDPSVALLSALAHKAARYPVLLALAVERNPKRDNSASLRLLNELSDKIEVEHLLPAETEALMRSLFGEVSNLPLCATRIHGLANGNPRATMELAQHLVATGAARYEAGSWALPVTLNEADLPATLAASLSTRLRELSSDARELADALAVTDQDAMRMDNYAALTKHKNVIRVFRAIDELVAARILIADAERYAFAQRGFLSVLQESMEPERRTRLHLRAARLLALTGGNSLRRAHHLLAANADAEAIDLLCRIDLAVSSPDVSLLATAIERAERLGLPASTLHRLRMALLINAPFAMASQSFRRVMPVVLAQLERDSGLARYRELAQLPDGERLAQALAQTQQSYTATPEAERVFTVLEAIRELARLSGAIASMASPIFDLELLDALPDLSPLFSLSPTLPIIAQLVEGAKEWVRGRLSRAKAIYEAILVRISEPDRAGFDDAQYLRVRLGLDYTLGMLDANWGIDAAEQRARQLEGHRELRVNAWRIRWLLNLAKGNVDEAGKCSRRAELLQAQEGLHERYVGSALGMELVLQSRLGDLLKVKGLLDRLAALAGQHPGWRSIELLGRALYSELQGDLEGSLKSVLAALEIAAPLQSPFFGSLAARHVSLLAQLGRVAEAVDHGTSYVAVCAANDLSTHDIHLETALVLARVGRHAEAQTVLDTLIGRAESLGASGLAIGVIYEAGARIAMWKKDGAAFDAFAERCAHEYEKSKNPALGARLAQLFDQAREHGLTPNETVEALRRSIQPADADVEGDTVQSRLTECIDGLDRARCALTMLLQTSTSCNGYLFGMGSNNGASLLAALPDIPPDDELSRWLQRHVPSWLEPMDMEEVTVSDGGGSVTTETGRGADPQSRTYTDRDGRSHKAVLLFDEPGSDRRLAAVLVLQVGPKDQLYFPQQLCAVIARQLIEHGDVSGWPA